jgi:hypothetical protein
VQKGEEWFTGGMPVAGNSTHTKVNKARAKRVRGLGVSPSKEGSNEGISSPSEQNWFVRYHLPSFEPWFLRETPRPSLPSP